MILPSGKHLQFANQKITMLSMCKSTISMAYFPQLCQFTRGYLVADPFAEWIPSTFCYWRKFLRIHGQVPLVFQRRSPDMNLNHTNNIYIVTYHQFITVTYQINLYLPRCSRIPGYVSEAPKSQVQNLLPPKTTDMYSSRIYVCPQPGQYFGMDQKLCFFY